MALSDSEKHGYAIMKQVEVDSESKVSMGPGTLYGSLKRMLESGLVVESDKKSIQIWTTNDAFTTKSWNRQAAPGSRIGALSACRIAN